jgi:hypothetical protein
LLRIVRLDEEVTLDKRTHLPFEVWAACPVCGALAKASLMDYPLNYPVIGGPVDVSVPCKGCDDFFEVEVVLDVTLKPKGGSDAQAVHGV